MCDGCYHEYGGPEAERTPEVAAVASLIHDFYQRMDCTVGGPLHVVLDDWNVEDDSLDWRSYTSWDVDPGTAVAADRIIEAFRPMTLGQRAAAIHDSERYAGFGSVK